MSALDELKKKRGKDLTELERAIVQCYLELNDEWAGQAAEELAAKNKATESAIKALRAVVHDRPTAHTEEVWLQVNAALSELESLK
jgi:tRNA threonylcarbamoyladenosine modification (KEOPS) complex Cgi121 subunit